MYAGCDNNVQNLGQIAGGRLSAQNSQPLLQKILSYLYYKKGEEKAACVQKIFSDLDEQICQGISENEMKALYDTLQKIMNNFKSE